ncbi:mannitol 1-phosphate dehydrogenase [Lophiostoma macrostomum CBS 122681]|uniref:Mannitol 1-phosphate dehydrogenase n=1 Tax=Lophiostoma macrostomum CBS 122681 TaxID=1314788 RepID=A0A6A6TMY0_9PLEO|nr:mannitol 1-phosphate dehydrogenase [Lophiostoma macrostomum CBS 122681]
MAPPKSPDPAIAIVGGGLGGLALAIGLLKHGVKIHIYEAASVFSEIGAGVAFGPNATRALNLIDEALLEGYKKHATFNHDRARDHTFMTLRWGMDERKEGGHKVGDLIGQLEDTWNPSGAEKLGVRTRSCIHRARLLDVLVGLLPEGITSFGKSFEDVEEQTDGTLKLLFADGTTASASAVIGCDGVKSRVRKIVCGPDVEASYVNEYAYRAMVPRADAEKVLGVELALNGHLHCGYGGYIVTYPVEQGAFINMVAIPHEPAETHAWNQDTWTVPTNREDFIKRFTGWNPALVELVGQYALPQKWALFDLEHNMPYCRGRIGLLGDAAHAATPHMGAGAGMAIEDAYILSNLIGFAKVSNSMERIFKAYDAVRRPRTQKLVEYSKISGMAIDFLVPDIGDNTRRMKQRLEDMYRWLWHEDLEAQLVEAKNLL